MSLLTRINHLRGYVLEFRMQRSKYERGWQEGYSQAMDEADEVVEDKDAFIAEQSAIIVDCMAVFDRFHLYIEIPPDLHERLRSYV